MVALLAIDTAKNRVRRYAPRRVGGRLDMTDEVRIIRPQCHTIGAQLNDLLAGKAIEYAEDPPVTPASPSEAA